jgi:hypothetical protein
VPSPDVAHVRLRCVGDDGMLCYTDEDERSRALGLKVAEFLVASGGRHLALLSRRPPDEEASRWLRGLSAQDVHVL